ncbi:Hypothetical Protein FCC1311_033872 [Hondaea fermentalgiana]|uniref:Uncharacterized protein n=1 Tax=Hondaea fermentalgiana TaxID=2315210 RepID=A0A2R5GH37_9STRA|nr:Hypothetical Protein FCC1311_033872 [Hondaea fermentalgiana]|eukprot:GBG27164.1 Hypothetical Protein FCC1311_033872 [Hondaea fermentalgiana]
MANIGEGVVDSTILRRTWSLHRVSPLHKFELARIEKYSRQLTRVIQASFESTLPEEELARRNATGERASGRFVVRQLADGSGLYVQVEAKLFHASRPQRRNQVLLSQVDGPETASRHRVRAAQQFAAATNDGDAAAALLARRPDGAGEEPPQLRGQTSMVLLCCTSENTDLLDMDSDYEDEDDDEEEEDGGVEKENEDDSDGNADHLDDSSIEGGEEVRSRKRQRTSSKKAAKNSKKTTKFTSFHFALFKGKGTVVDKIARWLETRFDCNIAQKPVPVAPRHLADMASSFTHEAMSGRFENVQLAAEGGDVDTDEELDAIDDDMPDAQQRGSMDDMEKLEATEDRATRRHEARQRAIQRSRAAQALELGFRLPDAVAEAGLGEINIALPAEALRRLSLHLASGAEEPGTSTGSGPSTMQSGVGFGDDIYTKSRTLQRIRDGEGAATDAALGSDDEARLTTAASTSHLARDNPLLSAISRFVAQQMSVRLSGASLSRIATPLVMISAEGRVKFLNQDALSVVLRTLAALCQVEIQKES